jgi:hypothetical protein
MFSASNQPVTSNFPCLVSALTGCAFGQQNGAKVKAKFGGKRQAEDGAGTKLAGLKDTAGLSGISAVIFPRRQHGFDVKLSALRGQVEVHHREYFLAPDLAQVQEFCVTWGQTLAASPSPANKKARSSPGGSSPADTAAPAPAAGNTEGHPETPIVMHGAFGGHGRATRSGASCGRGKAAVGIAVKRAPMNPSGVNQRLVDRARYKRRWRKRRALEGRSWRARKKLAKRERVDKELLKIWRKDTLPEVEGRCVVILNAHINGIEAVWNSPAQPEQDGATPQSAELSVAQALNLTRKALTVLEYYRAVLDAGFRYCQTACCKIAARSDVAQCHHETVRRYNYFNNTSIITKALVTLAFFFEVGW